MRSTRPELDRTVVGGYRYRSRKAVCLLLLAVCSPVYAAQLDDERRGHTAHATLPVSNEALLLSSQAVEAIQAGDYRLAVELIERLKDLPGGLVAAPASRTYYPVWRQAFRLQAQLPEDGVELYRQLHDAEVAARFQEAADAADVNALRDLFHNYRLSSTWPAIAVELAAHLLDRGAYGEAIEVLREVSPAGADVSAAHQAQLAVALAGAGALRPAERLLAGLKNGSDRAAQPEWGQRLEQLDRWLRSLGAAGIAPSAEASSRFAPCIEGGPVWTQTLLPETGNHVTDEAQDVAQAVTVLRRLPLQQPVLVGAVDGGLLLRLHGRLWSFDAETLVVRWSVAERLTEGVAETLARRAPEADRDDAARLSSAAELLLSDYLRHAVSVGFGQVYTVERLAFFDAQQNAFGQRPFSVSGGSAGRNELVARELDTGGVVWRTATDPADPLFDVAFKNVPLVVGDRLVAPIVRGKELSLAVIDPVDGTLQQEVALVGPPTRFTREGGRCLMISDETTLYVCTGNGVIAALARDDLSWKWAAIYPSTLAEHLGQLWWQPVQTTVDPNLDPPAIVDDLLIVAPLDSPDILALDRFSGRERWRIARRDYPFLVGAVGGGVVVGSHVLACLDPADPLGRPPRWKSVPLQVTGRAATRDGCLYVPTQQGIVVLDGQTGKVLTDQIEISAENDVDGSGSPPDAAAIQPESAAPYPATIARDPTCNLLVSDDALFSVSPERVVKYPDLDRARRRYVASAETENLPDRTVLVLAWLDAFEGNYVEAVTRLQDRPFEDPQLGAARDRLLTRALLGLAERVSAAEDRLTWLQRAAALADSPQSAARLAIAIGQTLEQIGRWPAALQHYAELLYRPEVRYVRDSADGDRRVADWLYAAERIRAIWAEAPTDLTQGLLDRALLSDVAVAPPAFGLQRLRIALPDGPRRAQVDRLLSLEKLAPELKIEYLPKADAEGLPPELRRRLHLERWDTHVSLGLLDQAGADRALWEARFASTPAPVAAVSPSTAFEPLSPEEERERVAAIDLAHRKLAQAVGQPFTAHVSRQWKIERAELLLDPSRPLSAVRPWVLVADLSRRRIQLINAYKHQHPQRQTEDGMSSEQGGPADGSAVYGPARESRRFEWDEGRRSAWPVVTYGHLAAIPVRGGLICVGLGPERYAGRRAWEYAIPEWETVPLRFADRAVAGPQGVIFTPRPDRVVLVGWFDGGLWWQRDFPDARIERLFLSDGRLVIVSDDQQVWVTDSIWGRPLRSVPTGSVAPSRVDVVGEMIVVWGADGATGIAVPTLQQAWRRESLPVADAVPVPEQPWIAYRARDDSEWYLLDARTGKKVFEAALGTFESISAIVLDGDRLYIAGRSGLLDPGGTQVTRVIARDRADGTRSWGRDFVTPVAVNPTQLAGHPDLIPLLIGRIEPREGGSDELALPAIQLMNKQDGAPGEVLSIRGDYRPVVEASCEMYMLTTPTRIIVQVGGNLIAYGNSPLRTGP